MRGRKSYNIKNIEAHISNLQNNYKTTEYSTFEKPSRNMIFQTNVGNLYKPTEQQIQNEYVNAKYGVSKYASNQVSGKMFKTYLNK
jgi:hypothetical protein